MAAPAASDILALTPEVAWLCQRNGTPYRTLEEFYSESALAAKHPAMFEAEVQWLDFVDRFFAGSLPEFAAVRFRPALATSFLFQTFFDEFFFASHAVRGLLHSTRDAIPYWPTGPAAVPDHLHPNQSLIPAMLADLAGERALPMPPITELPAAASPRRSYKEILRGILPNRAMGEYRQLRYAGLASYAASLARTANSGKVLVLEGGYDLDPLVLELRLSGVSIDWMTGLLPSAKPQPRAQNLEAALAGIVEQADFWKPLAVCGVGRNPILAVVFSHWCRQLLPQFWSAFQHAQTTFAATHYDAMIAWEAGAGTLSAPILQAAEHAGEPSVLYQHGSSARTSGAWWFSWLAHADKLLVYGDGTAGQLHRTQPPGPLTGAYAKADLVPVGSARLDSLRSSMTPSRVAEVRRQLAGDDPRPIALYVPTYFGGYGRATSDAAAYPEVSYFETQQDILSLFADYPGVRLLYKNLQTVNCLANPIPAFLARCVPNAGLMPVPPRLSEAMFAVDLIIVDHVITALGEALLTDKPIVVYDPGALDAIPEAPETRELLRKRVHLATTAEEFEAVVRGFLEAGDYAPVSDPNNEFQAAFSTQGTSIAAAAAAVRRLIQAEPARRLAGAAQGIR